MRFVTWDDMSPARRLWEAVGGALVWGIITGLLLSTSVGLYIAATLVAVAGGVLGGAQHAELRGALLRGLAGGTVFGLAVLLGFELSGDAEAVVELPDPRIAFLLFTVIPGVVLGALGWTLGRRIARRPASPPVSPP